MRRLESKKLRPESNEENTYLDAYFDLMVVQGSAHIFQTALSLKILSAFKAGPLTYSEVADTFGYDPEAVQLLLDGLAALRLLEKRNGLYMPSPTLLYLKGDYENLGSKYWDYLPTLITSGKPLVRMNSAEESEREYKRQVQSLDWMMTPAANEVAEVLRMDDSRENFSILDVGAGSGVWSIALLKKNAISSATLLDWKGVLEVARLRMKEESLEGRVSFIEGDYFSVDIPDTYDLIVVGNILHTQGRDENVRLLKKLRPHLAPSGKIAVLDVIPGSETKELARTLYELGLKIRTEAGKVYEENEIKEMLSEAGFSDVAVKHLDATPHLMGMCVAR